MYGGSDRLAGNGDGGVQWPGRGHSTTYRWLGARGRPCWQSRRLRKQRPTAFMWRTMRTPPRTRPFRSSLMRAPTTSCRVRRYQRDFPVLGAAGVGRYGGAARRNRLSDFGHRLVHSVVSGGRQSHAGVQGGRRRCRYWDSERAKPAEISELLPKKKTVRLKGVGIGRKSVKVGLDIGSSAVLGRQRWRPVPAGPSCAASPRRAYPWARSSKEKCGTRRRWPTPSGGCGRKAVLAKKRSCWA